MKNKQIVTKQIDREDCKILETSLQNNELPDLKPGEIMVKNLYVPIHGSFWLASNPKGIHPRKDEFLENGSFVFGNGGVAQVIESNEDPREVKVGDYVAVFGHMPCDNYDCYGCKVLHRYTECDYGASKIIGHGKNSPDGTYAEYSVLPRYTYEVCYREKDEPSESDLLPYMYSFLFADVRNAMTRHPDATRSRRMFLVGAGMSGLISAYLFLRSSPESHIFVVDPSYGRLEKVKQLSINSVCGYQLLDDVVEQLNSSEPNLGFRKKLQTAIDDLASACNQFYEGKKITFLFDSSSGNSAPLWDNNKILGPATIAIPFGFGSEYILLTKELVQTSGLQLVMSRGVGNIRNRKEVIELIRSGAQEFINDYLVSQCKELNGLEEAIAFIGEVHSDVEGHFTPPHAYIKI